MLSLASGSEVLQINLTSAGGEGTGLFGPLNRSLGFSKGWVWTGELHEPLKPIPLPLERFEKITAEPDMRIWTLQSESLEPGRSAEAASSTLKCWQTFPVREQFSVSVTGNERYSVPGNTTEYRSKPAIAICSHAKIGAITNGGSQIDFFDSDTGQKLSRMNVDEGFISQIQFSADGELLLINAVRKLSETKEVTAADGKRYSISRMPELQVWSRITSHKILSATRGVRAYFGPRDELLVTATHALRTDCEMYERQGDAYVLSRKSQIPVSAAKDVSGRDLATLSPAFGAVAVPLTNGDIQLWDVLISRLLATFHGHDTTVLSIAFSPDGKRMATAGGNDRTIRLWELETGIELLSFNVPFRATGVQFSADGQYLLGMSQEEDLGASSPIPKTVMVVWNGVHP